MQAIYTLDYFKSIILGFIEGVTEFLPISSTFHLLLASRALGLSSNEYIKLFDIFIQSGAILAVVWLYRHELITRLDLLGKTLVAFIPTAILGIVLYHPIKNIFMEEMLGQVILFIGFGLIFLFFEWMVNKKIIRLEKSIFSLTYPQALLIGASQVLAFFPGVSRAGAVILIMMLLGFRRAEAAFFSFFLAIPTIISAGLFDLFKSRSVLTSFSHQILPLSLGFIVSFLVAMAAIRWFINYLKVHSLSLFAFYRFFLGGLTLIWIL
ncbi:MAG: undecaprenyl-diphosphate phosphatase [Candidatus Aminicenantes bacterium]|nr:undecaprenyl-diphosphate phosphatase [Candidatus Aminicenantes bacterium]